MYGPAHRVRRSTGLEPTMAGGKAVPDNEKKETFKVDELDEQVLEAVSGGDPELNVYCPDQPDNNTNCAGGNCVAGCT